MALTQPSMRIEVYFVHNTHEHKTDYDEYEDRPIDYTESTSHLDRKEYVVKSGKDILSIFEEQDADCDFSRNIGIWLRSEEDKQIVKKTIDRCYTSNDEMEVVQ